MGQTAPDRGSAGEVGRRELGGGVDGYITGVGHRLRRGREDDYVAG